MQSDYKESNYRAAEYHMDKVAKNLTNIKRFFEEEKDYSVIWMALKKDLEGSKTLLSNMEEFLLAFKKPVFKEA